MKRITGLVFAASLLVLAGCASQQPLFSKPRVVQLPPPTPIPFLNGKRVLVKYNHYRFCPVQGWREDYAIVGPVVERHLAGPGRKARIILAERRREKPWTGYDLVAIICVSRATDIQQSIYGQAIYHDLVGCVGSDHGEGLAGCGCGICPQARMAPQHSLVRTPLSCGRNGRKDNEGPITNIGGKISVPATVGALLFCAVCG